MKKNHTMKIAIVLAVLTLFTACFVSGTFAKYVTTGTANDTARVAKFGVVVAGEGSMFNTEYEADDSSFTESTLSVKSWTTENVVAPGTEGEMGSFTLSGFPEVAVRVTYAITDVELSDDWTVKLDDDTEVFYCPLFFTFGVADESEEEPSDVPTTDGTAGDPEEEPAPEAVVICGLDYASADALKAALIAASVTTTRDFAPQADLSANSDKVAISWKWNYEADPDYDYQYILQTDAWDTQLGNKAAAAVEGEDSPLTISITTTCTVTQID